jgi:hypothetical protein
MGGPIGWTCDGDDRLFNDINALACVQRDRLSDERMQCACVWPGNARPLMARGVYRREGDLLSLAIALNAFKSEACAKGCHNLDARPGSKARLLPSAKHAP